MKSKSGTANPSRRSGSFGFFVAGAVLCIAVLAAQPVRARAQNRPVRGVSAERVVSRLSQELNLTQEQEERLRPVIEESAEKRREIFKDMRSRMEELDKSTDEKLSGILTEEQMEEYRNMREERRERRKDRRGGGRAPGY